MDVPNDSFKKAVDYIIVLGSGIRSEEVPPLLKSRLDKGLNIMKKSTAKFVVSGGQGPDEPVAEAFAMKNICFHKIFLQKQF